MISYQSRSNEAPHRYMNSPLRLPAGAGINLQLFEHKIKEVDKKLD